MMPDWLQQLDEAVRQIVATPRAAWLDAASLFFAGTGQATLWIVAGLVVAVLKPGRWPGVWRLVLALTVAWLVNDFALKPAFDRPRPFAANPAVSVVGSRPSASSMPSGHAATAFAGALALARMWPEGRLLVWLTAALVGWSRVYAGVHYPLDVLVGALVGLGCGGFVVASSACYIENSVTRSTSVPR